MKEPIDGWFKLLNEEEGEFYNIPIPPEDEAEVERLRNKMERVCFSIFVPFYANVVYWRYPIA